MKKLLQGTVLSCALMTSSAYANDFSDVEVSANFGMVSKYMWRGWNLNDELSAQGGIDFSYNGFTVGTWGGTDATLGTEIDLYLNYGREINEYVAIDVGVIQYRYPEKSHKVEEWHVTADFNFVSVTYHSGEDDYDYVEFNSSFAFTDQISVDVHYGFEDNGSKEWNDYQIALNYQINDTYSVFVAATEKERNDSNIYAGFIGVF